MTLRQSQQRCEAAARPPLTPHVDPRRVLLRSGSLLVSAWAQGWARGLAWHPAHFGPPAKTMGSALAHGHVVWGSPFRTRFGLSFCWGHDANTQGSGAQRDRGQGPEPATPEASALDFLVL